MNGEVKLLGVGQGGCERRSEAFVKNSLSLCLSLCLSLSLSLSLSIYIYIRGDMGQYIKQKSLS